MLLRSLSLTFAVLTIVLFAGPFDASARRPPSVLRAHEWGVWLFDGGVITVDDLARESPPFVHRPGAEGSPVPVPPDEPRPALKPVIYFHAPREVPVTIRVGFHNGTPWLFYPGGTPGRVNDDAGLVFSGRVVPGGRANAPRVARGHFWNHLRAASDSVFLASNGESESFVFYDGPSEVTRAISATRNGNGVTLSSPFAQTAYLVAGGKVLEVRPHPSVSIDLASIARSGKSARTFERTMTAALVAHGLTRPEATALVRTWHHELVEEQRPHLVSFVTREAYDRALPISISPYPAELVRVGVIIERL